MIIVAGSGVIGLSIASVLAENGFKVTVVADWFPGDPQLPQYASPWAGAHFRPYPSFTDHDVVEKEYTRKTLAHFNRLAKIHPESSVKFVTGIELLDNPTDKHLKGEGYEGIEDFKLISPQSINAPNGVKFACSYKTWVLNPPLYLEYLVRKLKFQHGVQFHRISLKSLKDLNDSFPNVHTIINATGQGVQYNGGHDPNYIPIRGQTLLIRAPVNNPYFDKTITYQSSDNKWTFVIPRPLNGGYIVGGTKQPNEQTPSPKQSDTDELIERGKKLFPELLIDGSFDIQKINVGYRPARKGGFRLEKESQAHQTIIHAYGAGGMGYEISHGVALTVLSLLQQSKAKL